MNKFKELASHPFISGSALIFGGTMLANAINYIYHLVMGRIMGPEDYGALSSLYSIIYIISVVPVSASIAIVKFISSSKNEKQQAEVYQSVKKLVLYIALGGSALLGIASPFISQFLHISDLTSVLLVAPVLFFSLATLVNQSTSQGILKFMGLVVPNVVMSIGKLIIGILLVLAGFSVGGAMFGVVVGVGLAYFVSRRYTLHLNKIATKKEFDLTKFLKYSGPVLIQAIGYTIFMSIDVVLVKHFFPSFDAGLYAAISTLGKIIYFAAQPITSAMFPVVAKRHSGGEKYNKVFMGSLGLTALISVTAVAFYAIMPEIAIGVLYGRDYLGASQELFWMGLVFSLFTLSSFLTNFFLSVGKTKIVYVPLFISGLQALLIWFNHASLMQIIMINLFLMLTLSLIQAIYFIVGYISNEA